MYVRISEPADINTRVHHCERAIDVTPEWREATDPRGEWGETCTAHLCVLGEGGVDGFTLAGLVVRDGGSPYFIDRDRAVKILGTSGVWNIESAEMQAGRSDVVDGSDFCRACRGTGGGHDRSWYTDEPASFAACHTCRGTGKRTVRVDPAA